MSGSRIGTDILARQIAQDEKRDTPRNERRPAILTAFRNFWALVGMLIAALFLLFLIAIIRIY